MSIATLKAKVEALIEKANKPNPFKAAMDGTLTEFKTLENFSNMTQNFGSLFSYNQSLTRWEAPNIVHSTWTGAFRSCDNLTYIDLGKPYNLLSSIFAGHSLIGNTIIIRSEKCVSLSSGFSTDTDKTTTFYVPKNLIEEYESSTNWSRYAGLFKAIEDYPEITGGII